MKDYLEAIETMIDEVLEDNEMKDLKKLIRGDVKNMRETSRVRGIRAAEKYGFTELKGTSQKMICHCGNRYTAMTGDLKRGWSLSCSKTCAALRRRYELPAAKLDTK